MSRDKADRIILEKALALRRKREDLLAIEPNIAVEMILDSHQPAALVHSFPEEDFYFFIHDHGPEDSLQLLSLASDRQWEYIVDVEVWEKDRLNIDFITRWFDLLFRSDPNRFIRWIISEKKETFAFYLFKHIDVRFREHDQDPSDLGEGYFTYDDTLYIRFLDRPDEKKLEGNNPEDFISRFLDRLADFDFNTFQAILHKSAAIIPAEVEEEEYRLRSVRLAEKGFLPFEEALGVYQPITMKDMDERGAKIVLSSNGKDMPLPVPLVHHYMLEKNDRFVGAMSRIEPDHVFQQIQAEFAGLCNQVTSADQKPIKNRDELSIVVKKACGYLSIGLEKLAGKDRASDTHLCAALIQRHPLKDVFRLGYGQSLKLKWKAERWRKQSWFESQELPLSFWGETWLGILGGLLVKRPMYFDNYKTGVLYREFLSSDELDESERILNHIIAFDVLLSLMDIQVKNVPDPFFTHKSLVLTGWAHHVLEHSEDLSPLTLEEFKTFFKTLWSEKTKPRTIRRAMKESFLDWLVDRTGLKAPEITDRLGQPLEDLFEEIESEYQLIGADDLDPKYILLFRIKE
jgi:uncharacterized protein DUF6178